MATLITVVGSGGRRCCDAKCYDAKGNSCECVCNGWNHGKGEAAARKITWEHGKIILENAPGAKISIPEIQQNFF